MNTAISRTLLEEDNGVFEVLAAWDNPRFPVKALGDYNGRQMAQIIKDHGKLDELGKVILEIDKQVENAIEIAHKSGRLSHASSKAMLVDGEYVGLHKLLKDDLAILLREIASENPSPEVAALINRINVNGMPGLHAEILSINEALWRLGPDVDMAEAIQKITVAVNNVDGHGWFTRCRNCGALSGHGQLSSQARFRSLSDIEPPT